ncbi:MAG: ATP-binding protein [Candidatus Omnitrophica bacterium]|nr:ATP-binding protein [Candidatus Omnitrophota bacterium]
MEILRTKELALLEARFEAAPVAALLGPRQCGKTTLAHQFAKRHPSRPVHFFDLESPEDLRRLENPTLTLEPLQGFIVIDEIQRRPELFPALRVLVDRHPKTKYLILGSASRDLLAQSSESLAGRISYVEIGGFSLESVPQESVEKLWIRGGFPRSFLATSERASYDWRQDFITSFLERDVPNLGIRIPAAALRRFWIMLSHYHGQIFNASEIGRSLSVSDATARHYLDILSGTLMIHQLQPWHYNTKKRLVKRPKMYFRDSGIFHALLGLEDSESVTTHPKLGASWEGFALEQVLRRLNLRQEEMFYWGVHAGAELDLVFRHRGRLYGVEVKYSEAPALTSSMRSAMEELSLAHLWVIYPGTSNFPLGKTASAVSIRHLAGITLQP